MTTQERKTAIVATSTSSLDYFNIQDLPLSILRMRLNVAGQEYIDGVSIRADALYQRLKENPAYVPQTRPPEPGEILSTFRKLKNEGYTDILVLTISKKISRAHAIIADLAKTMTGVRIRMYDTETSAVNEGILGYKAALLAKKGASIERIIEVLDKMKNDSEILFCVNNLKYMHHYGHVQVGKKLMASLLQIKPIISFKNGEYNLLETVYKLDNAVERLAEIASSRVKNPALVTMGLFMANQDMYRKFTELLPESLKFEYPLSPSVGAHVGIDGVGVAFCSRFDKYD